MIRLHLERWPPLMPSSVLPSRQIEISPENPQWCFETVGRKSMSTSKIFFIFFVCNSQLTIQWSHSWPESISVHLPESHLNASKDLIKISAIMSICLSNMSPLRLERHLSSFPSTNSQLPGNDGSILIAGSHLKRMVDWLFEWDEWLLLLLTCRSHSTSMRILYFLCGNYWISVNPAEHLSISLLSMMATIQLYSKKGCSCPKQSTSDKTNGS